MLADSSTGSFTQTVEDWAIGIMEVLGGPGAGLAIALENLFPPLPSEIILPLAGFAASQGTFGLVEVIAWTTLGSIVGALALYGIGAWLGAERLRKVAAKMPLIDVADVDKADVWFAKHGGKTVFLGRMIPIFRSLISIPAGVQRMNLWKFTALTAAGSVIWNTIFVLAGFYLGENWTVVEDYAGVFQVIVITVVIALVAFFVFRRVSAVRRRRQPE